MIPRAAAHPAPGALAEQAPGPAGGRLAAAENTLLAITFALLAGLPLAEIVLRAFAGTGFEGSSALVQHLTMALGMLGAAVAARDERLIAFSGATLLTGRTAALARLTGHAAAAAVSALLCYASLELVATERAAGRILAHGIPVWSTQTLIPIGFGVIGLRLLARAAPQFEGQLCAALLAGAFVAPFVLLPAAPGFVVSAGLAVLVLTTLLGAPLFALVGGAALILLWDSGVPLAAVAVNHYGLTANPSLPAIPLFTLAGYLLAESAAPRRLIEVFDALFGRLRGGTAIATVLACTFFTSFTGASGVTVLALGGLAMPLLLAGGYPRKPALGLITAAGLPGTLLLPSLPLILYAIVAGVSIQDMFVAGLLPALLMACIVAAWGISRQPARAAARTSLDWRRVRLALAAARWELSVPLVPILALTTGHATPVEAAALTAIYVLVITAVVHRDLRPRTDVPRVMAECGLIIGGILLIMGVALGLTNYLVDAQISDRMASWATGSIGSRFLFLLALNAFLLLAGCVVEIYPAILIVAPLVTHMGAGFGIDPVHLGIIFLANMELGYLTPLVGLNLFFASYRFGKPVAEVFRAVLPHFCALGCGVLAITYLPWLSTGLLDLVR
ncbi:MAG: TRAP transporter large permease subunit [Burkholderiales bacterium]|nr:TRAP transporter large permease subunit [Burkholderiales bacterium]